MASADVVNGHCAIHLGGNVHGASFREDVRDERPNLVVEGNRRQNALVDGEGAREVALLAQESCLGSGFTQGGDHATRVGQGRGRGKSRKNLAEAYSTRKAAHNISPAK